MRCSVALCLALALLMQFLLYAATGEALGEAANKPDYMAFVDLEKEFDRVPREVIWWAIRKLGIDDWLVRLIQSIYNGVRSRIRVGGGYSEEFIRVLSSSRYLSSLC